MISAGEALNFFRTDQNLVQNHYDLCFKKIFPLLISFNRKSKDSE